MTMASGVYGATLVDVFDATQLAYAYLADTVNFALVTNTYTPDFNSHTNYTDITNEVANGNGYTTGGAALGSKTCAAASSYVTFDAADLSWTSSTFTARGGVVWDDTLASDRLIMAVTFGADYSPVSGTLTVTLSASGLYRIQYV